MRNPAYWIGADVGGTNVKMVAVDGARGDRLASSEFPTSDSPMANWALQVSRQIKLWESEFGPAAGVGIASPGLVHRDHRSVAWMQGRMEAITNFDWTSFLDRSDLVPVLNDAHAALVGEAWVGAAKETQNAIMLTLGTGVGGAAMVDGRILEGALGRAGHLGHISLDPTGSLDIVGTPGSLEDAIGDVTVGVRSHGAFLSTEALVAAVKDGNVHAARVWDDSIRALAAGIASLINVLDPEIVVLGGGIARAGSVLLDPLSHHLHRFEWRPLGQSVPIVRAELEEFAGAMGAARFAMQRSPTSEPQ